MVPGFYRENVDDWYYQLSMIMIVIDVETAFLGAYTTRHFYILSVILFFYVEFHSVSFDNFFLWIVTLEEERNFFMTKCLQQTEALGKGEGAGEM